MRLGIDASNLRAGGGVTHLVELLHAAQPAEHGFEKVVVWAGQNILKRINSQPWLVKKHEPLLDSNLPARIYWQTLLLPKRAQEACDVLFVPGGSYRGCFRPVVTMSRNMLPFERSERRRYGASWMHLKLWLLYLSHTTSLRKADGVIFLSEYARTQIGPHFKHPEGHWVVIPHGVSENIQCPPRPQKPISTYCLDKPFRLLYVSIIDVYKHQWHVAEAVAVLRQQGLPVELELIGTAYHPALERLRKVIQKLDPEDKFIHYQGPISYLDLPKAYHRADGFVFASSCENMPNILLEAMAAGLPIACSNRGPMPEILGSAGVYFNPTVPAEIHSALYTLLEQHDLRSRIAHEAYTKASEYSWDRCAKETFSFIGHIYKNFGKF